MRMLRKAVETKLGTLVREDAVEWLRTLESRSARLVVADPPYNMKAEEWDRFDEGEYLAWTRSWVSEARRILTDDGSLYVMGLSETLADVKVAVRPLFDSCRWLVWAYRNKANLRDDWGRSHESILHLRVGKGFVFETDAVRIPYNAHTTRYPERESATTSQYGASKAWRPHPLGARPRDVLEIPVLANGTAEKTCHPTQKPVELVRRLVLASSKPGDLVIDPFAGSGTTAVVCEMTGRRWASCEREAKFCKVAARRIREPSAFEGSQTADQAATAARREALRKGR